MPRLLRSDQVKAKLPRGWRLVSGSTPRLQGRFTFEDFVKALRFVNQVGKLAEAEGHHPNVAIRYNRVTLDLWTHSMGGVTNLDMGLAKKVTRLLSSPKARRR